MKITGVDSILVALPYRHGAPKPARHSFGFWETQDILFIRVDTDAGITGWGEAFSFGGASVTQAAVRDVLAPLAIGQSLDDPLKVASELARRLYSIARGGPVASRCRGSTRRCGTSSASRPGVRSGACSAARVNRAFRPMRACTD